MSGCELVNWLEASGRDPRMGWCGRAAGQFDESWFGEWFTEELHSERHAVGREKPRGRDNGRQASHRGQLIARLAATAGRGKRNVFDLRRAVRQNECVELIGFHQSDE